MSLQSTITASTSLGSAQSAFTFLYPEMPQTYNRLREDQVTELARRLVHSYRGNVVVTLDGPASSGKSTQAQDLARRLGLPYLDSGSLYRCIALLCLRQGVPMNDPELVTGVARTIQGRVGYRWLSNGEGADRQHMFLDGEDVSKVIREEEISRGARIVSAHQPVRDVLRDLQREIGGRGCVTAGRAQGSEVFPDATLKIYLTADLSDRARRRTAEKLGIEQSEVNVESPEYLQVKLDLADRDDGDMRRSVGKLEKIADAVEVDSTGLARGKVLDLLTREVAIRLNLSLAPIAPSPNQMTFPDLVFA